MCLIQQAIDLSTGQITGTSTDGVLALMPGKQLLLTDTYQTVSSICLPVGATVGKNIRAVLQLMIANFVMNFLLVQLGNRLLGIFILLPLRIVAWRSVVAVQAMAMVATMTV